MKRFAAEKSDSFFGRLCKDVYVGYHVEREEVCRIKMLYNIWNFRFLCLCIEWVSFQSNN